MSVEAIPAPLTNILGQVESLLRPRALAKGIDFLTVLETPIPNLIQCDPTRLRQILMNLAGNAVKFTQQGKIRFVVRMHAEAAGNQLQIDIEDTGPGLTECQRANIFEAFSQADNSVTRQHGGTGLGLTISQRLARLLGGGVELLWTEPGRGTCFRITLPCRTLPRTSFVDNIAIVQEEFPPVREEAPAGTGRGNGYCSRRMAWTINGSSPACCEKWARRWTSPTTGELPWNGSTRKSSATDYTGPDFHQQLLFIVPPRDGWTSRPRCGHVASDSHHRPPVAPMAEDRQCLRSGCDGLPH
ncbi:MAG: ATP-binding protein [Planctomycetaceae bacterium]